MFDNPPPIVLTSLADGDYTVEAVGKNSAGAWQTSPPASQSWTVHSDVPEDFDGDGMPDAWEIANNFDPGNPADALADADGDGANNHDEFIEDTDPRNPSSVLELRVLPIAGGASLSF
jgi:hypothetical protein